MQGIQASLPLVAKIEKTKSFQYNGENLGGLKENFMFFSAFPGNDDTILVNDAANGSAGKVPAVRGCRENILFRRGAIPHTADEAGTAYAVIQYNGSATRKAAPARRREVGDPYFLPALFSDIDFLSYFRVLVTARTYL